MQVVMAANSESMDNLRANVKRIIAETPDLSVTGLAALINSGREKKDPRVSRTFLSNLLNGHFPCSVPFAEEIANALDVELSDLISASRKKSRQPA